MVEPAGFILMNMCIQSGLLFAFIFFFYPDFIDLFWAFSHKLWFSNPFIFFSNYEFC